MLRILIAIVALVTASGASAQTVIHYDMGGMVGSYIQRYQQLRDRGAQVVIDGHCFSACTLVLGFIPPERLCATERAQLGFHAAWAIEEGRVVESESGTKWLLYHYPQPVLQWIRANGGLQSRMIYLEGPSLFRFVRPCSRDELHYFHHRASAR